MKTWLVTFGVQQHALQALRYLPSGRDSRCCIDTEKICEVRHPYLLMMGDEFAKRRLRATPSRFRNEQEDCVS